jgi:hypothetical protein
VFCLPISIGNLKLEGAQDGSNVTIQVIYDGGDGLLYQVCAFTRLLCAFSSSPTTSVRGPDTVCKRVDAVEQLTPVPGRVQRSPGLGRAYWDSRG